MPTIKSEQYNGLKLLNHCGSGAYGDVYLCEDVSGKKMAIKIISKKKLGEHWKRELRGVTNYRKATENNSNLLQIYQVCEDESSFYYTMEAADSTTLDDYHPDTLAQRLKHGALPYSDLFPILCAVFEGIKEIHNAGFSHRDIKPDNIIFVRKSPKLADIGLISSQSTNLTRLAGTIEFIPPEERAVDSPEFTDYKSRQNNDLYAFGKVIYCCVTGCEPSKFPTIPKELKLSLSLKLFTRLSFQLCNKEPKLRVNSIAELEAEFNEIKRRLLYGESTQDKIKYFTHKITSAIKGYSIFFVKFALTYIWLLIALFVVAGGGMYWFLKPEPRFDLANQKTKIYHNAGEDISLTIPYQWEVVSSETTRSIIDEMYQDKDNNPMFTPQQIEEISQSLASGQESIYCDFDAEFCDNITIIVQPIEDDIIMNEPIDEIRLLIKGILTAELGFDVKIYEVKKVEIAGYKGVYMDFSYLPDEIRSTSYWLMNSSSSVTITLTSKVSTFDARNIEFDEVISTLKIKNN